jgi:hypothetical protein
MGRFQSIVARANKKLTLQLAAALLAGATLLSSVLGLFRDRLLNAQYLVRLVLPLSRFLISD